MSGPDRDWWLRNTARRVVWDDGKSYERPRAPITVRSLHQVGGERPNRVYLRKKNANARKLGFLSFADMALYFEKLARLAGYPR